MSFINNMAVQEGAVRANYEVNLAVNELAAIQESMKILNGPIVYEAEMIPVFETTDEDGNPMYYLEMDMFTKFIDSKNITIPDGVEQMYQTIKESTGEDISISNIAIVVKESDVEKLDEIIKSDVSKLNARYEAVINYTNKLKEIKNEGVKLITC